MLIHAGDIDIACEMTGQGYPLIMIMGYGATRFFWEEATIQSLAEDYKIITFDNRGIGETDMGDRPCTISRMAEDTFALLQALGIEKAHVLGWSMGSLVAQELALSHPDVVNGLVLYSSFTIESMFPPDPEVIRGLEDRTLSSTERNMKWVQALFPEHWIAGNMARIKEIFSRPAGNISREILAAQTLAISSWKGSEGRFHELPASTLLLTGDEDVLTPWENSRYMAAGMKDARLEIIKGTGHGLMFQEPERFVSVVKEYLRDRTV
jgi:pimeloyl-ACP methyl ester carboxylesterase